MANKEKKAKVKKVKPAAPRKAKKKERGEGVNFKELLALHFEKGLLGLAVLLTLLMVWSGFRGRQGIEPDKTPAALNGDVAETETLVKSYTWEKNFRESRVDKQDFPKRADAALRPLDAQVYATNQLIRPPVSPPLTKRTDPDLFAATDLQVRAGFGILDKSTSNRGRVGRGPGEDQDVFTTEDLDKQELDPDSGRPMPGSSLVGDARGRSSGETEGIYFASVTALVPVRKQLENYQANLANSRGHNDARDVPIYTDWVLQRSEVDASGNAIEFKPLAEGRSRRNRSNGPANRSFRMDEAPEAVHPDFRHPLLTNDPPEVDVRDRNHLFVHDRIVALSEKQYQKDKERRAARSGRGGRGDRRLENRMDEPRMDDSRRGDMRRGDPGFDRMGGQNYPEAQMPMEGQSGGRQGMLPIPTTGLSASMPLDRAPEFYMFRYIDRDVEVGKTYRYRLQLVVDDPNNSRFNKPPTETLEPAVAARVIGSRSTNRTTEFSAESPPVEILPGQQLLLAQTSPAPRTTVRETGQSFQKPGTFPSAKVMALIFDAPRSTDIPGSVELSPGGAVCFTEDTEIPLWNRSWLKEEKNFKFRTDFDVLDVRGGDVAGKVKLITKPGEILVRDPAGRIKVLRELDDLDLVAKYSFPKEEPGGRGEGGLDTGRAGTGANGRDRGGRERGGRESSRNARTRGRDG